MNKANHDLQNIGIATIGGGCFWCLDPIYDQLRGIEKVESGYSGGSIPNPSYELVCTGSTNHAEVVQLTFNQTKITFREILDIFFTIHDPTTLNRQGGDMGIQYRSIILYHTEDQYKIAREVIDELETVGIWETPIVTEVAPYHIFYLAEDYHQGYYRKNPNQGYCQMVITPKINKFRKKYLDILKPM